MLSQYEYTIEYRATDKHGNADALSRLPAASDANFDEEEGGSDSDTVCMVKTLSRQLSPTDAGIIKRESDKDPVISKVMRYVHEGWPSEQQANSDGPDIAAFRRVEESLSTCNGCLLYGTRVVIPKTLRAQILQILHIGHFGMQRVKQLARTAVYWIGIDEDIRDCCRECASCQEHQNNPPKAANHPWMVPEKPWSRLHIDHAIDFEGSDWLVLVDAYSKYPCIVPTSSTSTKATTAILEEVFSHFGYPHAVVTDNATTFTSGEFQEYCRERGIAHLTGAPYHPATNGAAERLVQSFKQSVRKSCKPAKESVLDFLMMYRRTPLEDQYSPSQLLNGRQIRAKIDAILPSPPHLAQQRQSKINQRQSNQRDSHTTSVDKVLHEDQVRHKYQVGTHCYAKYCGPRRNRQARWVPATVVKVHGPRSVHVKVHPRGPIWRRHVEQLRPRYGVELDDDPGEVQERTEAMTEMQEETAVTAESHSNSGRQRRVRFQLPTPAEYSMENPRRSGRTRKPRRIFDPSD